MSFAAGAFTSGLRSSDGQRRQFSKTSSSSGQQASGQPGGQLHNKQLNQLGGIDEESPYGSTGALGLTAVTAAGAVEAAAAVAGEQAACVVDG